MIAEVLSYFDTGGIVMIPLTVCCLVLWYGLGFRFAVLQRGSRKSVKQIYATVRTGGLKKSDGVLCEAASLLAVYVEGHRLCSAQALESLLIPLRRRLHRFQRLVNSTVLTAPLLGLLGTVVGMIATFDSLADQALFSHSGGIAGGVSTALFTTQMGLLIAVPGALAGRILQKRADNLNLEIDLLRDLNLCKHHWEAE